jgi:hypothetical protein
LGERLQEALPNVSPEIVQQVVLQDQNTVTTFVTLLIKEEQKQAEDKAAATAAKGDKDDKDSKDTKKNRDPIVTDTSCKP